MPTTRITQLVAVVAIFIVLSSFTILFLGIDKKPTSIRIACIGDSITEGSGYPESLQTLLGVNYEVGNFGVSGSTVLLSSDKPYMNQLAFQRAKAFQPSAVIIMLGTNDAHEESYKSVEDFSNDYRKLINEYQTLENNPQILLVKPPPIFNNNLSLSNTNLDQGIIPCIEQIANELGLPLIDINSVLSEYPEYFGDGVHPNREGALLIANEIGETLTLNIAVT